MYKIAENLMHMDTETWAKHANPISVYSRFTTLPLLALSIWSRIWIGWYALIPFILCVFWIWLNPRLFNAPKDINNWASKGVFGEQIFLKRKTYPIPHHHVCAAHLLTSLSAFGFCLTGVGLWLFHFWITLCGIGLTMGAKTWFFDRMVWLYQDMTLQNQDDKTVSG